MVCHLSAQFISLALFSLLLLKATDAEYLTTWKKHQPVTKTHRKMKNKKILK